MNLNVVLKELGLEKLPCPIIFGSKHLRFYEAGAFLTSEAGFWIELNKRQWLSYLGYDLQTVLKHELVHVLRKDFKDSIYEELIAYQVSKYNYQKLLGPFFSLKRGKMTLFLMPIFFQVFLLTQESWVMFTGLIGALLSFLTYFPHYIRLVKVIRNLQKEGIDPLVDLIKLSKEQLIEKASCSCVRDV
jgi:hypothetical protein